ncbi:MAG: exosortase [Rhodobacteraceae bacterium]|nr:exosortase [Paracoccaceae bacterium]
MIDSEASAVRGAGTGLNPSGRLRAFAIFVALLSLAFALPLFHLVRYALATQLHSHAVLIPFIAAYLVWLRRDVPLPAATSSIAWAVVPLVAGLLAMWEAYLGPASSAGMPLNDRLALTTGAFVCLLWAGALLILGWPVVRALWFPLAFLVFLLPLPTVVESAIEVFFQHTSAEAAAWMFGAVGTTMFRDGLMFKLPGIEMVVAEECSGIRSSLVLFITSLVAGQMFLRSPWRRVALTLFVIPLAIVRNGFRVFTIGMLCVHIHPDMIHSAIHKRGGPLFFALSLVPFMLVLLWLWRSDRSSMTPPSEKKPE